jgi:hypothetical protein
VTPEQIAAAQLSVESSFSLITQLVGGNMVVIWDIVAVMAVVGILSFLISAFVRVGFPSYNALNKK